MSSDGVVSCGPRCWLERPGCGLGGNGVPAPNRKRLSGLGKAELCEYCGSVDNSFRLEFGTAFSDKLRRKLCRNPKLWGDPRSTKFPTMLPTKAKIVFLGQALASGVASIRRDSL